MKSQTSLVSSENQGDPTVLPVACERTIIYDIEKLKYSGKTCVRAFIQEVEEFVCSRGITYDRILNFAYEIFTGDALHWYRYVKDNITSWNDLVRLKDDFSSKDYDYRLLAEIRSRTQGENESIAIYLSIMHGMFSRLVGLLDSVSSISVLGNGIHEKLIDCNVEILKCDTNLKFTAAGGQSLSPLGKIKLPVTFRNQTHTIEMFIVPEIQDILILGTMGRPKECSRPFQMLSMDLIGPLPVTRKQNTFIFVVTCCFSKYSLLFPIKRATSNILSHILEEKVFLVHGIPSTVLMDNSKQFTSSTFKNLLTKYEIPNIQYTPKYTPQVNTVERYNKTIIVAISSYIENDHRLWDTNIPKIQFALNSSVNEATGFTPSFLVFGRELVPCGSHYIDVDMTENIIFSPRDDYAENLGTLHKCFDKVQLALLKAHSRNSSYYNLRRKVNEFNIGDIVWKRTYYLSDKDSRFAKKLAPKFLKCRVVGKRSPLIYELQDFNNNKNLGIWHMKDLKRDGNVN
ncbi:unnamed protein product, partial [Brenthis ino]